jgi:hypothetical protein
MTHEKYITLIQKLDKQASEETLDWEVTASGNSFQTTIAGYVLRISEEYPPDPDEDSAPDYVLALYNQHGYVIETVSDPELRKNDPSFDAFGTMRRIYKNARRSAMGASKAVDAIIKGLDDIIPF